DATVVLALNQDGLLEDILADHFTVAMDRLDASTGVGQRAFEFDVGGVLVAQATFEAPAHPGQPRRIQRQPLLARHLDRNRLEIAQPRRAAQFTPAWPEATGHFALVARANLFHLDAHAQG